MSQSGEKLAQWSGAAGTVVAANTRVTINPRLHQSGVALSGNNAMIVKVFPDWCFIVASRDAGAGTFDIQNITDDSQTAIWYAEYPHSIQWMANQGTTAGTHFVVTNPSVTAPVPIEIFNAQMDYTGYDSDSVLAGTLNGWAAADPAAAKVAAMRNGYIEVDTTAATGTGEATTMWLPTTAEMIALVPPGTGMYFTIKRRGENLLTINGNGTNIEAAATLPLPLDRDAVNLIYVRVAIDTGAARWEVY